METEHAPLLKLQESLESKISIDTYADPKQLEGYTSILEKRRVEWGKLITVLMAIKVICDEIKCAPNEIDSSHNEALTLFIESTRLELEKRCDKLRNDKQLSSDDIKTLHQSLDNCTKLANELINSYSMHKQRIFELINSAKDLSDNLEKNTITDDLKDHNAVMFTINKTNSISSTLKANEKKASLKSTPAVSPAAMLNIATNGYGNLQSAANADASTTNDLHCIDNELQSSIEHFSRLRLQRKKLLEDLAITRKEFDNLLQNQAAEASDKLQQKEDELQSVQSYRESLMMRDIEINEILLKAHGMELLEESIENIIDMNDYLQCEYNMLVKFYQSKLQRYSRIMNIEVSRFDNNNISVLCKPRSWIDFFKKPNKPQLTNVEIIFTKEECFPIDIIVKINTSMVPKEKYSTEVSILTRRIQLWKQAMLKSVNFDLASLFRFFI